MKFNDQDSHSLIQNIHSSLAEKMEGCCKAVSDPENGEEVGQTAEKVSTRKVVKLPPGCHLFFQGKN